MKICIFHFIIIYALEKDIAKLTPLYTRILIRTVIFTV